MAFMEFLKGTVMESAANAYTEVEVKTPASRTESMAMLIWQAETVNPTPDIEDGQDNSTGTHWAKRTLTSLTAIDSPDCIQRTDVNVFAGGVEGSLSEYLVHRGRKQVVQYFDPPILYPRASLFYAVASGGNASVKSAQGRIGYTLEKVSPGDFIAALVD